MHFASGQKHDSFATPVKKNLQPTMLDRFGNSELKTADKSYGESPSRYSGYSPERMNRPSPEQREIASALMEFVRNERLLEHSKQQIAVQSDYNTYDAFKVFD